MATNSTLHEACRLGDADETQRLLDAGTNINARDQVSDPYSKYIYMYVCQVVARLSLLPARGRHWAPSGLYARLCHAFLV